MPQKKESKKRKLIDFKAISQDKFVKIALMILLLSFFLGYTMRFLDFTKSPIFGSIGVIYPIHQETYPYYSQNVGGGEFSDMNREIIPNSPIDFLYVIRNNIVSAVLVSSMGVLIAIPTAIFTFLVGMSAGASIPEVLEFASTFIAIKTILLFILYTAAITLAASIGLEIGFMILKFIKDKKIEVNKTLYDKLILLMILVIINIILQYVLLVM
ncbi:MAG: hypothetical protein K0B02_01605 [DPANN group archaeon]|nr:hypothetical protein [DPANN group archaeon]